MDNQPQACIHESAVWSLPAVSPCQRGTLPPIQHSVAAGSPANCCVCVCHLSPACPPTHRPALHPWEGIYAQAPESRPVGEHHGSAFPLRPCPDCGDSRPLERQCALAYLHVWLLEASNWDDSAEQKLKMGSLASLQLKCLWAVLLAPDVRMCCERLSKSTPFATRHFQGCSVLSQLFEVCVSLE